MAQNGWHVWMVSHVHLPAAKTQGTLDYRGSYENVEDIRFSYRDGCGYSLVEKPDVTVGAEDVLFTDLVREALRWGIFQRGFTVAICDRSKAAALRQMRAVFAPVGKSAHDHGCTRRPWSYF